MSTGTSLIAVPATDAADSTKDIKDGQQFRIGDAINGTTFEFESGPTLNFPVLAGGGYSQTPAAAITDGMSFTLSGKTFEFQKSGIPSVNGDVAIVYHSNDTPATLGAEIVSTVNATPGFTNVAAFGVHRVTFSGVANSTTSLTGLNVAGFSHDGLTGSIGSATLIPFTAADSAQTIANAIASKINSAGISAAVGGTVHASIFAGAEPGTYYVQLGSFAITTGVNGAALLSWGLNASDINLEPNETFGQIQTDGFTNPITTDAPFSNLYSTSDQSGNFLFFNTSQNVFGRSFFNFTTGDITGISLVPTPDNPISGAKRPDRMFAVSDSVRIYEVFNFDSSNDQATMQLLTTITDPASGSLVDFTGLTVGPAGRRKRRLQVHPVCHRHQRKHLGHRRLGQHGHRLDHDDGRLAERRLRQWCEPRRNRLAGPAGSHLFVSRLQPVARHDHARRQTRGRARASPVTTQCNTHSNAGHGVNQSFDFNIGRDFSTGTVSGGTSYYFGLENNPGVQPQSINYEPARRHSSSAIRSPSAATTCPAARWEA